ncbi:MAG: hypothetical protein ACRD47_05835 [Nitrososphaeraceae archaeon]
MSTKVEQRLQWRRDKVKELSVRGHTQRQIASILKIGLATVNEDLQYLRGQARDNIKHYIDEYLPAEYENCLDGLNNILTEAWQMSSDGEKKERMQALTLAKECYAMKLDLLSNATVVDRAVQFVMNHRSQGRALMPQDGEVVIDDSSRTEQVSR